MFIGKMGNKIRSSLVSQTNLGKVSKQKTKNGWINPSRLAGWGQPAYDMGKFGRC